MAAPMINFNIGVLGHIDSGKTALCKALSTVESTASFDKNPQSKERGITLDLGFSSFSVEVPEHISSNAVAENTVTCRGTSSTKPSKETTKYGKLQYTLVDCPGHASLIRTIIGGKLI